MAWFGSYFQWLWDDLTAPNYFRIGCIILLILTIPIVYIKLSITVALTIWALQCVLVACIFKNDAKAIEIIASIAFFLFIGFFYKYLAIATTILYALTVFACFWVQEWLFHASFFATNELELSIDTASCLDKFSYCLMILLSLMAARKCFDSEAYNQLYQLNVLSNISSLYDIPLLGKMAAHNFENGKHLAKGILTNSIGKYLIFAVTQTAAFKSIMITVKNFSK